MKCLSENDFLRTEQHNHKPNMKTTKKKALNEELHGIISDDDRMNIDE